MKITWLLTWLNMSVVTLNAMFRLLVLYRFYYSVFSNKFSANMQYPNKPLTYQKDLV